jgi:hypothetical protein
MRLYLRKHAQDRMTERVISREQIEWAISHPNLTVQTPQNSVRYEATFPDGRTLKVWVVRTDPLSEPYTVKSVAWKGEDDARSDRS